MQKGKNQHVTPHPNGGWQVKGEGNSRATARTQTQAEAIKIARGHFAQSRIGVGYSQAEWADPR